MLSDNSKLEFVDLLEKLEDQLYSLDTYIEENEQIDNVTWKQCERLIANANLFILKIKYLVEYS